LTPCVLLKSVAVPSENDILLGLFRASKLRATLTWNKRRKRVKCRCWDGTVWFYLELWRSANLELNRKKKALDVFTD